MINARGKPPFSLFTNQILKNAFFARVVNMAEAAEGARRGPKRGGLSEEPIEFETSEEVDVTPTFDSLGLRDELIRGIYAYGFRELSKHNSRFRKAICYSAACYQAYCEGPRCYCSVR